MPTRTGKTALTASKSRKSPRKRTKLEVLEALQERLMRKARKASERPPLPFVVHESGILVCVRSSGPAKLEDYMWEPRQVGVAKAALASGYTLAVPVPDDYVGHATAAVCRSLGCPVCAGYDPENKRLVIWPLRDDDDEPTLSWKAV